MNKKQLQLLISAGVFSAALLSGTVYAEDNSADAPKTKVSATASAATPDTSKTQDADKASDKQDQSAKQDSKQKKSDKSAAQMGCSSANGCGSH